MRSKFLVATLLCSVCVCCVSTAVGAAVVPVPIARPAPPPNPDPFNVQAPTSPTPSTTQPTVVVPAPNVYVQSPQGSDIFNWLWTAIGGIFTALFGFKVATDPSGHIDLKGLLNDPDFRLHIDQTLLKFIQSGLPAQAVSQIPTVGAFEPLMRKLITEALDAAIAKKGTP